MHGPCPTSWARAPHGGWPDRRHTRAKQGIELVQKRARKEQPGAVLEDARQKYFGHLGHELDVGRLPPRTQRHRGHTRVSKRGTVPRRKTGDHRQVSRLALAARNNAVHVREHQPHATRGHLRAQPQPRRGLRTEKIGAHVSASTCTRRGLTSTRTEQRIRCPRNVRLTTSPGRATPASVGPLPRLSVSGRMASNASVPEGPPSASGRARACCPSWTVTRSACRSRTGTRTRFTEPRKSAMNGVRGW